jgi:hypothetical protein
MCWCVEAGARETFSIIQTYSESYVAKVYIYSYKNDHKYFGKMTGSVPPNPGTSHVAMIVAEMGTQLFLYRLARNREYM